jgi:hypothetical protein
VFAVIMVDRADASALPPKLRRRMRLRAVATLAAFAIAAVLTLRHRLAGFGLACGCLVLYLRPQAPGN